MLGAEAMSDTNYTITPIGVVHSSLTNRDDAPCQGDEGAPEAWLELRTELAPALVGIMVGDEVVVLTWLHQAQRDVLQVHPRGRADTPLTGVFVTRSPDRPNPIGMHRVSVLEIVGARVRVAPLEAIDGTPIVDIKPVLGRIEER
jgi:tRNA-Thr(GGU) m(6)t(6)A37 methyltransferase TsaA